MESEGGWNQEDADYLYAALDRTGNATQAHLACRDLAIQRLKGDPRSILNLFLHKYEVLWGNDDFGSTWNILFMDQQGTLTKQRQDFLYSSRDVGNLYYLYLFLVLLMTILYYDMELLIRCFAFFVFSVDNLIEISQSFS